MPLRLTNAPAKSQRALHTILTQLRWKICLVYIKYVIIFSNTIEEHIGHVEEILMTLKNAGATLKIDKCHLFQQTIAYLGHTMKAGGPESTALIRTRSVTPNHRLIRQNLVRFLFFGTVIVDSSIDLRTKPHNLSSY